MHNVTEGKTKDQRATTWCGEKKKGNGKLA